MAVSQFGGLPTMRATQLKIENINANCIGICLNHLEPWRECCESKPRPIVGRFGNADGAASPPGVRRSNLAHYFAKDENPTFQIRSSWGQL